MQQNQSRESWRQVVGFEGRYEVSDRGRIRSIAHDTIRGIRGGRIRKVRPDKNGYLMVDLYAGDIAFTRKVHRLVLEAFVGPCPAGCEACHYPDRTRTNNRTDNLRWDTASENRFDAVKTGTHPRLKFDDSVVDQIFELREAGKTHRAIAGIVGCSKPYVEKILYRKLRTRRAA